MKSTDILMTMMYGGSGGGYPEPTGSIEITSNGTHNVKDKASAVVNVPNPSTGSLSITSNGTYDVTAKASAVVNVPNPSSGNLYITANGIYDVTTKASVEVNVSGSGTDTITAALTNRRGLEEWAPQGIEEIPAYCFKSANPYTADVSNFRIRRAILPSTLGRIGEGAFYGVNDLELVDITTCQDIGSEAFAHCDSLRDFIIRGAQFVYIQNDVFDSYSNITLYVPASEISRYQNDQTWSQAVRDIVALEDYTVDGTTTGALRS